VADEMVRKAQQFINGVYGGEPGIDRLPETGETGWSTMFALTRALPYELGITSLSGAFGPTAPNTLTSKYPVLNGATVPSRNFTKIIRSALYRKGYDGGDIDGTYNSRVASSMARLKQNMGVDLVHPGGNLVPKAFKGLLDMDAHVTANGGTETVRAVQRWLNGSYVSRRGFYIIPADGNHSRDVARSMLFAVRYELGVRWGGDDREPDESLFSIGVPPGDERLKRAAAKIRGWNHTPGLGAGTQVDPAQSQRPQGGRTARGPAGLSLRAPSRGRPCPGRVRPSTFRAGGEGRTTRTTSGRPSPRERPS